MAFAPVRAARAKNAPREAPRRSLVDDWIPRGSFEIIGSNPLSATAPNSRRSSIAAARPVSSRPASAQRGRSPSQHGADGHKPQKALPQTASVQYEESKEDDYVEAEEVENLRKEVERETVAAEVPRVEKRPPSVDFSEPTEESVAEVADADNVKAVSTDEEDQRAKRPAQLLVPSMGSERFGSSAGRQSKGHVLADASVQTPVLVGKRPTPQRYPHHWSESPLRARRGEVQLSQYNGQQTLGSSWNRTEGEVVDRRLVDRLPSTSILENARLLASSGPVIDTYNGQMEVPPSETEEEDDDLSGRQHGEEGSLIRLVHVQDKSRTLPSSEVTYGEPNMSVFNGQLDEHGLDVTEDDGEDRRYAKTGAAYRPIDWSDDASHSEESISLVDEEEENTQFENRKSQQCDAERDAKSEGEGGESTHAEGGVEVDSSLARGEVYDIAEGRGPVFSLLASESHEERRPLSARIDANAISRKLVPFATAAFFVPASESLIVDSVCGVGSLRVQAYRIEGSLMEDQSGIIFSSDASVPTIGRWMFDGPLRIHFQSEPLTVHSEHAIPAEARNGCLEVVMQKKKRMPGQEISNAPNILPETLRGENGTPKQERRASDLPALRSPASDSVAPLKEPAEETQQPVEEGAARKEATEKFEKTIPSLNSGKGKSLFGWNRIQSNPAKFQGTSKAAQKLKAQLAEARLMAESVRSRLDKNKANPASRRAVSSTLPR